VYHRLGSLDVQDRRIEAGRRQVGPVVVDFAFQQAPVGPHVLLHPRAVGVAGVHVRFAAEHLPVFGGPGAQAPDHQVALDIALVGVDALDLAADHIVAGDFHAAEDAHAVIGALLRQAVHRLARAGVAADALVQGQADIV